VAATVSGGAVEESDRMLDRRWRAKAEQGLEPVGRALHTIGVSADALTVFGLVAAAGTGLLIANGNLLLAVFGLALTGLPDVLDGSVARQSGTAGRRGAFFDSVCDRVADALLLGGVAWHLTGGGGELAVLAFAVLAATMLVSYERAKAEALGLDAHGGVMERAERIVLLGIGLAFDILIPVLWLMLALVILTAVHRFVMVWRQASTDQTTSSHATRDPRSHRLRSFRGRASRARRLPRVSGRR
jgi:CDP-diacylglycerol--glycerol-3-phosphate 3-phosphatidyltransferase